MYDSFFILITPFCLSCGKENLCYIKTKSVVTKAGILPFILSSISFNRVKNAEICWSVKFCSFANLWKVIVKGKNLAKLTFYKSISSRHPDWASKNKLQNILCWIFCTENTDVFFTKDTKTLQHNNPVHKLQEERCDNFQ